MANLSDLATLEHYFIADFDTGSLYWRINKSRAKYGDVVGTLAIGYMRAKLNQEYYAVHRILFQMYHGLQFLPPCIMIDHVNMNRSDNRICNLRTSNYNTNGANRNRNSNRTQDLPKNIRIKDNGHGSYYYQVEIQSKGYRVNKTFPLTEAGLQSAIEWKREQGIQLFGEYFRE